MQTILRTLLDVTGVGAAIVLDGAGHLVCHRGRADYDKRRCEQVGGNLAKAVDAVELRQEDWETIAAHYANGKLLLRNLGSPGGREHVLAVIGDRTLNFSLATVAIRVAAVKLKKALGTGSAGLAAAAASQTPVTLPLPPKPGESRVGDSKPTLPGLNWSQTSSAGLSRVPVADPASGAFLHRSARELARHVGPIAKVYVEESVRRVSPDGPFSLPLAKKLVEDLAFQIEDPDDRASFRRALAKEV
ncbi:MAG TPA: roadblock/LC7 domain-containing protein [Anaeromyxobacteraceae bacterium]|nr:roadblock/LC7 domain-containing protein [Anaeromyxobacteraceae bacterium]